MAGRAGRVLRAKEDIVVARGGVGRNTYRRRQEERWRHWQRQSDLSGSTSRSHQRARMTWQLPLTCPLYVYIDDEGEIRAGLRAL